MYVSVCVLTSSCMCIALSHTHVHTQTCTHICTHTHTHTHTHTLIAPLSVPHQLTHVKTTQSGATEEGTAHTALACSLMYMYTSSPLCSYSHTHIQCAQACVHTYTHTRTHTNSSYMTLMRTRCMVKCTPINVM